MLIEHLWNRPPMKGTHQLEAIESNSPSAQAQDLGEAYLRSTRALLPHVEVREGRWPIACEAAQLRRRLRDEWGLEPCDLGFCAHGSSSGDAERIYELLQDVIGHFRAPALTKLVDQLRGGYLTEAAFTERLCRALNGESCWTASLDRLQATDFHTTQEDLLLQELSRRIKRRDSPALSTAISAIKQARSIDNARACLHLVDAILQAGKPPGRTFLSIGAGTGAFEHLLAMTWSARLTAIDTVSSPFAAAALTAANSRVDEGVESVLSDCVPALTATAPGSVSVLVAKDVLHELSDPATVLTLAARVCAPEGLFLVVEPAFSRGDALSLQSLIELDSTVYPASFRSPDEWRAALLGAGFEIEHHLGISPGIIDNNDMFPRTAILARKRSSGRISCLS
jgi:SAM-dependent methyltransferase